MVWRNGAVRLLASLALARALLWVAAAGHEPRPPDARQ